jgi:hypothetical protein
MVTAQDAVRRADVVQDHGAVVGREFTVAVPMANDRMTP